MSWWVRSSCLADGWPTRVAMIPKRACAATDCELVEVLNLLQITAKMFLPSEHRRLLHNLSGIWLDTITSSGGKERLPSDTWREPETSGQGSDMPLNDRMAINF